MKKIILLISVTLLFGFVIMFDIIDRNIIFIHQPKFANEDWIKKDNDSLDIVKQYELYFNNPKYQFPRKKTAYVKLYKNIFLLSRPLSKTAKEETKNQLIAFFNNTDNFSWGETTWSIDESEYILRFFDEDDKEIGKVFLCIEGCGMTKSLPFSPNMKFGGLSEVGNEKLNSLINLIKSK